MYDVNASLWCYDAIQITKRKKKSINVNDVIYV